ncbi:hypothetical protein [Paraliomyxa miuraensis]|uniref:hypothetical protein n=1 Tax=Paraliomyxa miuraensis TaxID=376150 RepID=UPI00225A970F|nr:hypothetical protein [Paraliomyxa miuraensis]MCX4242408.1 hypothetical protein [Paraliomyxa miuraensis]
MDPLEFASPSVSAEELALEGDAAQRYVDGLSRAIARARLSDQYPPGKRLAAQVSAMGPAAHGGLYPELRVDRRSGLPSYREWTRVSADAELSSKILAELPPEDELRARAQREAGGAHDGIWTKQLRKLCYHRLLSTIDGTPPSQMVVKLRRVDPGQRRAWFHVVLDKLDQSGVFVRSCLDLAQTASFWSRPMLRLDDDAVRETQALRTIIYRLTSLDAELTFVRLADTEGLTIERVIKGTVGPVYVPGVAMPEALRAELPGPPAPGFLMATFGLDMAAGDVAEDGDNDPVEDLLTERLDPEGQAAYAAARQRYGYRVYKDRKLVVSSPALVDVAHRFCARMGTRNVVYALRGGAT